MNRPLTLQELNDWANKTWNEIVNQKDIIAMAEEAGFSKQGRAFAYYAMPDEIERFAALVAAAEREACAYRAGIALLGADRGLANRVDQSIRARGETK